MNAGRHSEVIAELDALTVEHPFRESLRGLHMLALYRSGRQAEALRAFGRTRESLVKGWGSIPHRICRSWSGASSPRIVSSSSPSAPRCNGERCWSLTSTTPAGSGPAEREIAFAHRESELDEAADREAGVKLAPKGTAGYVVFADPIHAVRAARAVVNERTRVAVDFGDLEIRDDEPIGPPLARAARLVAVAHPGQVLVSSAAHDALTADAEAGWAAESLGRFDIVGLDPGVHIYQLVGQGFSSDFPALRIDRLPPPVPGGADRSVPGYELRALIGVGQLGEVHRAYQPSVGREVAVRIFGPSVVGHPQFVRRFETASQRITRVEHPHIVPLVDYWREPDRAVMVSRLLGGGHLGERIPGDGFDAASSARPVRDGRFGCGVGASPRRGTRPHPARERAVRRGRQRLRRRSRRRRGLCRGHHVRDQCLRRTRTPRWRPRHARGRCVLPRHPDASPARRIIPSAGRTVAARRGANFGRRGPGDRSRSGPSPRVG